jgi:hypothetical protein
MGVLYIPSRGGRRGAAEAMCGTLERRNDARVRKRNVRKDLRFILNTL